MEQRHKDYTDYYEARMKRYENHPIYFFHTKAKKLCMKPLLLVKN